MRIDVCEFIFMYRVIYLAENVINGFSYLVLFYCYIFLNLTILWFQLSNDLSQEIAPICKKVKGADFGMDTPLSPTNSETGESLFELYLAVQEFIRW